MRTGARTCRWATERILDGDAGPEIQTHIASCPDCAALSRDVAGFERLVQAARPGGDLDCLVSAQDRAPVQSVRGSDSRSLAAPTHLAEVRNLRRLRGAALVALAAGVVGVATAAVLWEERAEPRAPGADHVAMGETSELPLAAHSRAPAPPTVPVSEPPPATRDEPQKAVPRRVTVHPAQRPALTAPVPEQVPPTQEVDAPPEPPGPSLLEQARDALESQRAAMQRCYDHALRRDLRMRDVRAEITVGIEPDGSVREVEVEGEAQGELGRCLRGTLQTARFPPSEGGVTISVPFRFEIQRERMRGNVGTTSD